MPRYTVATAPAPTPASGAVGMPKLQHALLLNRFFCRQLGADSFSALQSMLHEMRGGVGDDGLTAWCGALQDRDGLALPGGAARLAEYDRRITGYVERLNRTRAHPRIALTYYQWLALLFTEMFLDRLYGDSAALRRELNGVAATVNAGGAFADLQPAYTGRGAWQYPAYGRDADLKKIAFWAATGSGKTLLMHIHLWQWQFYARPTPQNGGVLLITPNEGLSRQHLDEFRRSGIAATRYEDAGASGLFAAGGTPPVIVIEITKLTEKKKGGGQSVGVAEFEAFDLVLVDEGHRGTSSELGKWRDLRGAVGRNALTLEYSATFGQIVNGATAAKKPALLAEYAAAILFDFSYPHFYADGYGKDYDILNSSDDADLTSDWVMLANLLSYYEQCLAYAADPDALRAYNIERPLWIFVGHSVVGKASSTEDKDALTDVQTVAGFFARFLSERGVWTARLGDAFSGSHPLKDGGGHDLLERRFASLRALSRTAEAIWADMVRVVFRARPGETLSTVELKAAPGEIGLRAGAANPYFGVINIGDVQGLKVLLERQNIPVEVDAMGAGLFTVINSPGSPVNVLVGSRKFMEGWDSFRVSSMGLLNIGQGEGSQIIQLFGRGVRLRGKNFCLKRSAFLRDETTPPPAALRLLETLTVFGVRASYMAKFRESLQNEGIAPDVAEVAIPIRIADTVLQKGLGVLRLQGTFQEPVLLRPDADVPISLDLCPRVQAAVGGPTNIVMAVAAGVDQTATLRQYAPLLDWNRLALSCMAFRRDKGLDNLALDAAALQAVFREASLTVSGAAGCFPTDTFSGLARMEEVVLAALTKYIATFYERRRKEWETKNLRWEPLTKTDGNLEFGQYVVKISTDKPLVAARITEIVAEKKDIYERELTASDGLPTVYLPCHLYQPLLRGWEVLENSKPGALEPSESAFVDDLRAYLKEHPELLDTRELFLLRNQVTYGIVFYDETGAGFYPDFLLWLLDAGGAQTLVFIDPHGIGREGLKSAKVQLHARLKDEIAPRLRAQHPDIDLRLDSFILAPTSPNDKSIPLVVDESAEDLKANHILFQKGTPYIKTLFEMIG